MSNADVPFLPQLPYTNNEVLHDTMTECYCLVPGVYSTVDELSRVGGRSTRSTRTTFRSTTRPTTKPAAADVPRFTSWRPRITRRAQGTDDRQNKFLIGMPSNLVGTVQKRLGLYFGRREPPDRARREAERVRLATTMPGSRHVEKIPQMEVRCEAQSIQRGIVRPHDGGLWGSRR